MSRLGYNEIYGKYLRVFYPAGKLDQSCDLCFKRDKPPRSLVVLLMIVMVMVSCWC